MSDSSTKTGNVRNCPNCRIRMSSKDLDSHVICVACRGKNCNSTDRCDFCKDWTDDRMSKYLKHQATLQRKRESKRRMKETPVDFAVLCTGGSGSGAPLSEDGGVIPDVDIETSASSLQRVEVHDMVATSIAELGSQLDSRLDKSLETKFNMFSENVMDFFKKQLEPLTPSFPAPQNASVQLTPVMGRPEPPRPNPPTVSHNQEGASSGTAHSGIDIPPPQCGLRGDVSKD